MLRELLGCIGAAPAGLVGDTATDTLDNVGTYRAAGTGTTWIFAIMPASSCSRMWQW